MSFISYAQNFEDVLLWRALGHIKNGFYIDIGANDPEQHSVTKAFYERGWYGVNVEPLKQYQPAFLEQRPRDINLCVAAGAEEGEITLFEVPAVPGWASAEPQVARTHELDGFELLAHTVPLRTLRSICAEHVSYDIHFLKIDVEGHEAQVLRGMDFERWRPWILVIEATMPNSRATNHQTWEALVTGQRYQFAYFDGLNRYYVAAEHPELLASLQVQPNVFDDFISVHLAHAWSAGEAARALALASDERAQREQALRVEAGQRADSEYALRVEASQRADSEYALRIEASQRADSEHVLRVQASHRAEREHALRVEAGQRADAAFARAMDSLVRLVDSEAQRHLAEAGRAAAEAQVATLCADLRAADEGARTVAAWAHDLNRQLMEIGGSPAWRTVQRLRLLGSVTGKVRRSVVGLPQAAGAVAALTHRLVLKALRATARSAPVRKHILPRLLKIPAVELRVVRMAAALQQQEHPYTQGRPPVAPHLSDLPPSARKALADLERVRRRSTNYS